HSRVGNRRSDAYGGHLHGRMVLAKRPPEAAPAAWPADKPLFFRCSVVDGKGGHWEMDDTVALAKELKQRGVDYIDCSCGGLEGSSSLPAVPRHLPGYNVVYSEHVRREANIPTIVVGMITEPEQAEAILRAGKA